MFVALHAVLVVEKDAAVEAVSFAKIMRHIAGPGDIGYIQTSRYEIAIVDPVPPPVTVNETLLLPGERSVQFDAVKSTAL